MLGCTADELAAVFGVTPAAVRSWERGAVEMGAADLYVAARLLGVPVSFFFDPVPEDPAADPEALVLVRAYAGLDAPGRQTLRALVGTVAERL